MSALSRVLVVLTSLVLVPAAPGSAARSATYTAGGTAVVKESAQPPVADAGVLRCDPVTGNGVGGACVSFASGPSTQPPAVSVKDARSGAQVAFQVCVDNNGDGLCTSPDLSDKPCTDVVVFSHDDAGNFFNPLGPLPPAFTPGCPGGAWKGYVVFLCEGVHGSAGGEVGAHVHPATTGTVSSLNTAEAKGFGTFCGGAQQSPSRKPYVVA